MFFEEPYMKIELGKRKCRCKECKNVILRYNQRVHHINLGDGYFHPLCVLERIKKIINYMENLKSNFISKHENQLLLDELKR